jgi:hypothetical protein
MSQTRYENAEDAAIDTLRYAEKVIDNLLSDNDAEINSETGARLENLSSQIGASLKELDDSALE